MMITSSGTFVKNRLKAWEEIVLPVGLNGLVIKIIRVFGEIASMIPFRFVEKSTSGTMTGLPFAVLTLISYIKKDGSGITASSPGFKNPWQRRPMISSDPFPRTI